MRMLMIKRGEGRVVQLFHWIFHMWMIKGKRGAGGGGRKVEGMERGRRGKEGEGPNSRLYSPETFPAPHSVLTKSAKSP